MQSITIGMNQAGQRLDKFLHKYLPLASNSFLYKMLRKKNITLNGKKAEGKEKLSMGDQVTFFFSDETLLKFTGRGQAANSAKQPCTNVPPKVRDTSDMNDTISTYLQAYHTLKDITVLYEDSHVLILNKPAGILSQKAKPEDASLNEWMIGYLLTEGRLNGDELLTFRPSVVNRLDRNTSGLVMCGASLAGSQALSSLIHDHRARKFYRTIAAGCIEKETCVEGLLTKDERANKVKICEYDSHGEKEGSYIRTIYRPLLSLQDYTYLEVELITGKPHQIRAHLASTGHPLLGDNKYGAPNRNRSFQLQYGLTYQLLHACRLEFPSLEAPLLGLGGRTVTAPLPELFIRILSDLSPEHRFA